MCICPCPSLSLSIAASVPHPLSAFLSRGPRRTHEANVVAVNARGDNLARILVHLRLCRFWAVDAVVLKELAALGRRHHELSVGNKINDTLDALVQTTPAEDANVA